jgi:hypothetical protein
MTTSKAIGLGLMSLFFYASGALCVFKTKMLIGWGRSNHAKSKFVQTYPFSNTVMKPSSPISIRCAGIFIWLWALAIDYLVLFRGFR